MSGPRPHPFANDLRQLDQRSVELLRLLDPQPRDTVLELGTAGGGMTIVIAPRVRRVIGVDIAPAALEAARARLDAAGIDNVLLVADNAAYLSRVAGRSVDKVYAYDLVESIDDDTLVAMLEAAARVVRPAGTLSLHLRCGNHYVARLRRWHLLPRFSPEVRVRTTQETLRLVARLPGWEIDTHWHSPSSYPMLRWLDRAFYRVPAIGRLFRDRLCLRLRSSATN